MKWGWSIVAVVLVAGALAASASPDPEAPAPPEIQAIIDKVHKGTPLSEAEQKKLSDYSLRHRDEAVEGMTMADVLAIVNSARATGQPLSAADEAKIKAWAAAMKGREAQLKKDAEDVKRLAGTAGGPRRAPPADLHEGRVHVSVTQRIHRIEKSPGRERDLDTTTVFDVTYPVHFDVHDEGERGACRVTWRMQKPDLPVAGRFGLNGLETSRDGDSTSTTTMTAGFAVHEPAIRTGAMTDGEFVVAHGAARPYLQLQVLCPTQGRAHSHTQNGASSSDGDVNVPALPPLGVAVDGILEDTPLKKSLLPPKSMPEIRRNVLEKLPVEVKKAAASAQCEFDVADFRTRWARARAFTIPVRYDYTFPLDDPAVDGHPDVRGSITSTSRVTFEFGPQPSVLSIGPESSEKYKKWLPVPFTDDKLVAQAFSKTDDTRNDSVCLSVVVRFTPPGGAVPPSADHGAPGATGANAGASGGSAGTTGPGTAGAAGSGGSAIPDADLPKGVIKLHWDKVSKNKGVCANYPVQGAVALPGVFIPKNVDGGAPSVPPRFRQDSRLLVKDDGTAETTEAVSSITIKVAANDAGGYGNLIAECPDLGLTAIYEPTGKGYLSVPRDDDENHVADGWRDDEFHGKPATLDEDSFPARQRDSGDGLTLYEEYRGFICLSDPEDPDSLIHVRTDPDKKDVFAYDEKFLIKKYYMPLNPAKLEWHFFDKRLMRFSGVAEDHENRWFNYNSPDDLQYAPQYAMYATTDSTLKEPLLDAHGSVRRDAQGNPRTKPYAGGTDFVPSSGGYVWVPLRDAFECRINLEAPKYGFDGLAQDPPYLGNPALLAVLEQDKVNFATSTVIHEIGHYLGIHHHFPVGATVPAQHSGSPWPETAVGDSWGVRFCTMRYDNDPWDGDPTRAGVPYDLRWRYCEHDDRGREGPTGQNEIRSDDCWGQIKVKSERR